MDNFDLHSEVNKVANRKRINEEMEKLKEKVGREKTKMIKLSVGQDTAYWDLREKLQTVEASHGRLQANMMDVQMQHEAVSMSYQAELRRRPETLNKLAATRAIADTIEGDAARLRENLRRQAADCTALQSAYTGAAQRASLAVAGAQGAVRAQRASFDGIVDRERAAGERARSEALRAAALAASHCQQAESARRDAAGSAERAAAAAAEVELLRGHLQAARRDLDQITARYAVLAEENEGLKSREDNTAQLLREAENERERVTGELRATRDLVERRDVEVERVRAEMTQLEAALRAECDAQVEAERSGRARAEAEWRAERDTLVAELRATRDLVERRDVEVERVRAEMTQLEAALRAECDAQVEAERSGHARAEAEWRTERDTLVAELRAARDDDVARLEADAAAERARFEAALAAAEERAAALVAELEETRARGRADLAARADTISALMRDVASEAEARARAERALCAKEADLSGQIDQLRAEKERLQDTIRGMQETIDNIQQLARTREVQPASMRAPREPAERDAGAGSKTLDFSFLLSDASGDSMVLDAGEVDRRFAELGLGAAGEGRAPDGRRRSGTESGTANRPRTDNRSGTANRYGTDNRSGTVNRSGTDYRFFKNKRLEAKRK